MKVPPTERTSSADAGAHVVRRDDRSEALGGGDRLQPRDAGAEHEHAGRGQGSGGGHRHREHPAEGVRRHRDEPVPATNDCDREHVHGLGPRDAGEQVEGEHGDATVAGRGDALGVGERVGGAERDGAAGKRGDLCGLERPHVEVDVGGVGSRRERRCGHRRPRTWRRSGARPLRRRTRRSTVAPPPSSFFTLSGVAETRRSPAACSARTMIVVDTELPEFPSVHSSVPRVPP